MLKSVVVLLPCLALVLAGCAAQSAAPAPTPAAPDTVRIVDTVRVEVASEADREVAQRAATLQMQLLEKEAELADVRLQLDATIREVVRSMSRLQTLATRAEAASAMAEAEVAVQQLEGRSGGRSASEYAQAKRLLEMSSGEFNRQNYGGSVYLANQAKGAAATARGRLAEGVADSLLPNETRFSVPVQLQVTSRSNVRSGPGTRYGIAFALDRGAAVTGHSYVDQWVRISDAQGRRGWIFYNLISALK
ncbi:MAG TPA: SH3 domain-containing protein [Gemmatimonadales bacterium]|nr:SH3 domain-containing protein [Gemmatimonadales bacterium]